MQLDQNSCFKWHAIRLKQHRRFHAAWMHKMCRDLATQCSTAYSNQASEMASGMIVQVDKTRKRWTASIFSCFSLPMKSWFCHLAQSWETPAVGNHLAILSSWWKWLLHLLAPLYLFQLSSLATHLLLALILSRLLNDLYVTPQIKFLPHFWPICRFLKTRSFSSISLYY